ncbi:hypothetical protein [Thermococcus sp. 21S7]|uniref:hypothetical protein n=1 Tax=Thermococcus sp. 21S7 TaxID=1638221 RepID=UPI00143C3907|nr:hypothetical protein [Thermococcus sp. 21S7]NJE62466.1 hypothetical protein [Thermococcus sp. 21S7]
MRKALKLFVALFVFIITFPLVLTHAKVLYYDLRYGEPVEEGRLPDEVKSFSLEGEPKCRVKVREGVMLIETENTSFELNTGMNVKYSEGSCLLRGGRIYAVFVETDGIVGVEGLYRDIDVVYHIQRHHVVAFKGNGAVEWQYLETAGCRPGGGCYPPEEPRMNIQDGKLYVTLEPPENRTLVFSLEST